jgi:uncharacterized membrane-anchored protein
MKPMTKAALLLVPILALSGLSLLHEYNRSTGVTWTVPITGYDPRDLLSGHYLLFRYEWNLAADSLAGTCIGSDCALCAQDPSVFNPVLTRIKREDAPAACASYISGSSTSDGVFAIGGTSDGLTRYYVPESEADRLQRLLTINDGTAPEFSVGLRVTKGGSAYIETLYIDDVPLEQWLRTATVDPAF